MEVQPPDRGDQGGDEGAGTGLPTSLAAAVKAGLHERRETWPSGRNPSGERLDAVEMEAAEDILRQEEAGGAERGIPLESSVSVVKTGHERSKGEVFLPGGKQPGGQSGKGDTGAASAVSQVEDASKGSMDEDGEGNLWETAGRRRNKGTAGNRELPRNREGPMIYEQREGDWSCKTRGCEDFMNFRRRTHCKLSLRWVDLLSSPPGPKA